MKRLISPSIVDGTIKAPPSKSAAQRAIAIASLTKGESEIINPGSSDDVKAAINVCKNLGLQVNETFDKITISGGISPPEVALNCGESGLCIRMFSPIAATFGTPVVLTGSGTLKTRPMDVIKQSILAMGADCKTNNDNIPITVKGPFKGGKIEVDGSLSSQVLTGIMIAAPKSKRETTIIVKNLKSKPYIDLTIDIMKTFGVIAENNNYKEFKINAGCDYIPTKIAVEGDWSGASFLLVAGAIAGKIRIENLSMFSKQADKAITDALIKAGAEVLFYDNCIEVKHKELNGFCFDATDCPDLFPPLVALAVNCKGISKIKGVSRLYSKESNRSLTLQKEFSKLNADITTENDTMIVNGGNITGGSIYSHGDHRIAMSCAITAINASGTVEISNADSVNKSYPNFFEDLEKCLTKK